MRNFLRRKTWAICGLLVAMLAAAGALSCRLLRGLTAGAADVARAQTRQTLVEHTLKGH